MFLGGSCFPERLIAVIVKSPQLSAVPAKTLMPMAPFLGCLASLTPVPSVCAGDRNYDRCYLNALPPPPPPSSGTLRNTPRPRAAITPAAKAMEDGTSPNSVPVPHWQGNWQPVAEFAVSTLPEPAPARATMVFTVIKIVVIGSRDQSAVR